MYSRHRTVSKVIGILNKLPLFGTLVRQIAKKMLRQQHEAKHLREITNHVKDSRAHLLAVGVAAELCVGHRSYGKLLRNYLIKHLPIILASSTMGNQAFLNIGESHETRQAASYLGQSESNHETLHVGRDAKEHQLPHTPMSHMAREKGDTRNAEGTASTWGSHLLGSNQKLRPGFRKRQLRETKPTTRKGDLERTVGKRQTPHPTTAKANRIKSSFISGSFEARQSVESSKRASRLSSGLSAAGLPAIVLGSSSSWSAAASSPIVGSFFAPARHGKSSPFSFASSKAPLLIQAKKSVVIFAVVTGLLFYAFLLMATGGIAVGVGVTVVTGLIAIPMLIILVVELIFKLLVKAIEHKQNIKQDLQEAASGSGGQLEESDQYDSSNEA
eukprot:GHVT01061446.1.p1 GENE.GHVT01061446.1~~GHVT01061446.1.p1  ORF type:complete len:387 (-),score=41.34 GHVT01061446.1:306-1466(-)